MNRFVIFIFCLFPLFTEARGLCPESNSTVEMNQCLNVKLERAVTELSNNLTLCRQRYVDQPQLLASLEASQEAWENYRKAQCKSVFLLWHQASAQTLMTVSCSIQLARERNQFLQQTYLGKR